MMSVSVNENVFKGMEDLMNNTMVSMIRRLAEEYGFDSGEACEKMGLISLSKEKGEKKEKTAKSEGEKKEKSAKSEGEKKEKTAKSDGKKIPFPFMGKIIADKCKAVKLNHGLYTQCTNPICEGDLCKGCKEECDKTSSGDPMNGYINRRMMLGDNYVDSKGKKPIAYSKVLQKLKLTKETVLEEAKRQGIELNDSHFSVPPRAKAGRKKKSESSTSAITSDTDSDSASSQKEKRGRPKKQSSNVEVEEDDLFARLVQEEQVVAPAPVPAVVEVQTPVVVEDKKEESNSKPKKDKKALVIEGDEDKKAKKKEKADRLEKERLEKERLEKEKREKEEAERLEKERLEKERLEKEKRDKEEAELSDVSDDEEEEDQEEEEEEEEEDEDEDAPPVELVSKFEHNGKKYLKSENNVVYDIETQDAIGVWNPDIKMIELHELEEEEDYESDDE